MNLKKALISFIVSLFALFGLASNVYAQCSVDYHGLATINEVHRSGNNTRFVEVKLLSSALTSTDYDQWTVRICGSGSGGGCTGNISLSIADDSNLPWITIPKSAISSKNYINFRDGTDVIFKDGNGDTIDYVSAEGYTPQRDNSCASAYPWEINSNNTTHTASRHPDGTGVWVEESGNSGDNTPGDDNNGGNITGPDISIADTAVMQGETATLTVTLSATHSDVISFTYETQDNTAQAGVDYQFTSGTGSIGAGQLSTTISVPTTVTGNTNVTRFYVQLTSASNARIVGQVGVVTIMPSAIGSWQMEQSSWTGSFGEVINSAGDYLHGTARGVSDTGDVAPLPARQGDPGTCRYGNFNDGGYSTGRVEVADDSRLDLESELTLTAWVRPTHLSGSFFNPNLLEDVIVSKGDNYKLSVNTDGKLVLDWGGGSLESTSSLSEDTWAHVAATFKNGEQKLYINGELKASSASNDSLSVNSTELSISGPASWFVLFYEGSFEGQIDEVQIYSSVLSASGINIIYQQTHPCSLVVPSLDHFDITVPPTGSTCAPVSVLITAIDTNGDVITGYTGTVDISTSSNHGNWSKQTADGNLSPDPDDDDDGDVQYAFAASDNGDITLNLENTHADALTVSVEDNAESVLSTSSKITFSDNVFVISENDALDYDVVAGRDHQFIASLWTKDSTSGLCAVNVNYHGLFDLKAWITNGVNDAGGAAPKLLDDVGAISMPASLPASNNITLDFSSGLALFNWRTTDVAQHTLNLLDDTSDFVVDELGSPLPIISSNIFSPWAVRPFGFYLEVIGNPKAANANGEKYIAAGNDFTVKVTAVRYDAGDDGNGDGHPDGHDDSDPSNNAALSDNLVAASFGNETDLANPELEPIDLSSLLILPAPLPTPGTGTDPGLNVVEDPRFSSGVATKKAQFNEVGIIEIKAVLTSPGYLNNPAVNVHGASGVVGRFYPASFDISFASLSPATFNKSCNSSFTYMDQPFLFLTPPDVTITAVNAHGDKTENYEKDFWKLGADLQEQSSCHGSGSIKGFCYTDNVLGDAILSAPDANQSYGVIDDVGGEVVFTLHDAATDEFIYGRPSTGLIAPFDADVQLNIELEDSDGVTGANALSNIGFSGDTDPAGGDQNIANDEFLRYGRWVLENAFGPETAPLKIPMSAQYYDGTTFVTNTDDSCSVYDSMGMQVDPSLKAGGTTTPLGSGTASSGFAPLADQIELSAPGVGHEGTANLCLTVDAWLKFDWNGDGLDLTQACDLTVSGEQNDNPTSTATFGRYRGHDRIIYWREVSN